MEEKSTRTRTQHGTRSIELLTMFEIIQTQYINEHIMAIMAKKKLAASRPKFFFLPEKIMPTSKKKSLLKLLDAEVNLVSPSF